MLLLLLVGLYDEDHISKFPKTAGYSKEEFYQLCAITNSFLRIWITPYILSEITSSTHRKISNNQLKLDNYFNTFQKTISKYKETYCAKNEIIFNNHIPKFGMTDTSILLLAQRRKCLVLTNDGPLVNLIQSYKLDVINFEDFKAPLKF